MEKHIWFATFPPFRAPGSSFFGDFLFLIFFPLLFSDSSHLCFSSVQIVGSLTSKLPSIRSIDRYDISSTILTIFLSEASSNFQLQSWWVHIVFGMPTYNKRSCRYSKGCPWLGDAKRGYNPYSTHLACLGLTNIHHCGMTCAICTYTYNII